jgi:CDP-2,3-bis-(O-geranylgeranyl)-sn-glycerol synthase
MISCHHRNGRRTAPARDRTRTLAVVMTAARIATLLYQMAPAYAANMAPPLGRYWRGWNRPINARWLGEHKTVIGFGAGVVAAVAAAGIQSRLPWSRGAGSIEHPLAHGLRLGFGAMLGDTIKSFLKRRAGIPAGVPWVPLDQTDFVLGALAFAHQQIRPSPREVLAIVALSMAGHVVVNPVAYYLGIRDTRW